VTYWNAFVANIEMHGKGRFFDPRLNDTNQFPVAARNGFGDIKRDEDEDLITSKSARLHFYQLAIPAPTPPKEASTKTPRNEATSSLKAKRTGVHLSCAATLHRTRLAHAYACRSRCR
jgi:hypothetical protein